MRARDGSDHRKGDEAAMPDGKQPAFARVWETVLYAVGHSKISRRDEQVLFALMQFQGDNGELSRPSGEIARLLGMDASAVRRSLTHLTKLEYTWTDDTRKAFLTQTKEGRRGQTASYRLNVPREWTDSQSVANPQP
mgnify:CR=1 FL=1